MANSVTIQAEARHRAGTGGARATRRAGRVPAIVYGAKQDPSLISLEPRSVVRELARAGWQSRLFELAVDGATTRALIRDVQYHPVSDQVWHVDFQRLAPGEKIKVAVPVHFEGDTVSPGLKRGGVLNVVRHAVEVYADPDSIPERFEAQLATLEINDNVRWTDLVGTAGTRPVITDRDFVICSIASPSKLPEPAAGAEGAAATAAPAKGTKAPAKAAAPAKGAAPAKPAAPAKKK